MARQNRRVTELQKLRAEVEEQLNRLDFRSETIGPARRTHHPGDRLMANFKKTVATAKAKVAKAEIEAFNARLEAMDAILQDAPPHDVMTLCVRALAEVAPNCCEAHQDEFKAELLRALGDCVAIRQEQEEAEDDEAYTGVH
jgi:hypothetical protein